MSWHPAAIPGLIAVPIVVGMAAVVFLCRPDRSQNRFLAALMLSLALGFAFGHTLRFLVDSYEAAYASYVAFGLSLIVMEAFHLLFLASLNVRWLSSLRRPLGRVIVLGLAAVTFVATVVRPGLWAGGMEKAPWIDVYVGIEQGPVWSLLIFLNLMTGIMGIVASVQSARRAKAGLERRKGSALARAYIAFELIIVPFLLWALLYIPTVDPQTMGLLPTLANFYTIMLASFVLAVGLAVGILRSQLFDMDVKIRWTVKRGTLAGIFIATFFMVSQFIQNFTTESLGTVGGAVGAGLLLFAINPLQRFADRLSVVAVPAKDAASLEARKLEIYKAALEGAWQDGKLSPKERTVLTRLQLELGIANSESKGLEAEVRKALGTS